jgi:solute carrier family 45 protein 1/2/4
MVVGSLIVAACLIIMAWAKEIVGIFISDEETGKTCTIVLAVLSIYAVDFAINAGKPADNCIYQYCELPSKLDLN